MTPLDAAHAAMEADLSSEAARLRFYGVLADAELILLVTAEGQVGNLSPQRFDLEDGPVILAFDTEDRLAEFVGGPAPYAALPGRVIVAQLAGQGVGLGVNLGVAPSSILLPPAVVDWLAQTLSARPDQAVMRRPKEFSPPDALPPVLINALRAAMDRAVGLGQQALLVGTDAAALVVLVDTNPATHEALARMISEAVAFSGYPDLMPDVLFLASDDPALAQMRPVAVVFDLQAAPIIPEVTAPKAPGSDPSRPPILR